MHTLIILFINFGNNIVNYFHLNVTYLNVAIHNLLNKNYCLCEYCWFLKECKFTSTFD